MTSELEKRVVEVNKAFAGCASDRAAVLPGPDPASRACHALQCSRLLEEICMLTIRLTFQVGYGFLGVVSDT